MKTTRHKTAAIDRWQNEYDNLYYHYVLNLESEDVAIGNANYLVANNFANAAIKTKRKMESCVKASPFKLNLHNS